MGKVTHTNMLLTKSDILEKQMIKSPMQLHLWEHRSLFLGLIPEIVEFVPACAWLLVGLNNPFEISMNDSPRIKTHLALVPAGGEVRYVPEDGILACCFLDVLSRDYQHLAKRMKPVLDGLYVLDNDLFAAQIINNLRDLYFNPIEPALVYEQFVKALDLPSPEPEGQVQESIAKVVNSVRLSATENLTNGHYAAEAGISEEVLARWFRQVTGLTLRRYRNWHRLFLAAWLMQQGVSLTEAAHEVGFSDAAHFNHVFREMLGLKPSFIQRAMAVTRIYLGGMLAIDGTVMYQEEGNNP